MSPVDGHELQRSHPVPGGGLTEAAGHETVSTQLVVDIEADALAVEEVTRVHCIGLYDLHSKSAWIFHDAPSLTPPGTAVSVTPSA